MRFEALRERLLRAGIAPRRVRRYLDELDDHLAELTAREITAGYGPEEASSRARALLGSDDDLGAAWLARPELKSFIARAPWAVFVLAPPFALLLAFMVPAGTMLVIGRANGMMTRHGINAPLWYQDMTLALAMASNLLLPILAATLLVGIATRQRLSPVWPLIGIGLIVAVGVQWHAGFPSPGHRDGYIAIGTWFSAGPKGWQHWPLTVMQTILTLLPALALRSDRRRRRVRSQG